MAIYSAAKAYEDGSIRLCCFHLLNGKVELLLGHELCFYFARKNGVSFCINVTALITSMEMTCLRTQNGLEHNTISSRAIDSVHLGTNMMDGFTDMLT